MVDAVQSATGPKTETDHTVESAALAGAAAIQRIIADRDNLRSWASSQRRELVGLRATNEDLRRRLLLIRQHYLEFATHIIGQFEQFDAALNEALQDPRPSVRENETLVDLARRLSPTNRPSNPSGGRP